MLRARIVAALLLSLAFAPFTLGRAEDEKKLSANELIEKAIPALLRAEEETSGRWPYEGVYRVAGDIPVAYRIGGTAIVSLALLYAAPDDAKATAAIERGRAFILGALDDPLMAPSTKNAYDVRVWGHAFALELFLRLRDRKRLGDDAEKIKAWIPKLVETLVTEEIQGGGWNYASRNDQACFVTAPVVQTLLLARSQGEKVPDEVFARTRKVLEGSRDASGYFEYSGPVHGDQKDQLPGSVARSANCEATLALLGGGQPGAIQAALDAFHAHWGELEKRRKKTGTHEGKYHIAPYYFYYGHRYAALAIELLPEDARKKERARLLEAVLRTRDEDGTWNDRVFPRSRAYGTAMVVLALLGDRQPLPPHLAAKKKAWR